MKYATCHPNRKHQAKGLCKPCYTQQWLAVPENKERSNKSRREWAARHYAEEKSVNPELLKLKSKIRYNKNIETNRIEAKERQRKRRNAGLIDLDKEREAKLRWKKRHPEKVLVANSKRRAIKLGTKINDFTEYHWELLKVMYYNSCYYCGDVPEKLTQDHMIPLSRGGDHTFSNIVPACSFCNSKKGSKTAEEFICNVVAA